MKLKIWIGILGLCILLGLLTAYRVFSEGFILYAKTDVLIWTLPLSAYIFFSLTSAGLAFISSIPVVFGLKRYETIKKRTMFLELAFLAGSFVCLILHLGAPLNFVYFILSPNPASPLWWMGVLYTVYLVVLAAAFMQLHRGRSVYMLNLMVFLTAIATSTTLGWLIGMTDARPVLNPTFLTLYFPATALVSGLGALLLFGPANSLLSGRQPATQLLDLYDEMARVLGIAACLVLVLFLWRYVIGSISSAGEGFMAFKEMRRSASFNFEFWIGLVAPSAMMLIPAVRKTGWGKITASFFILSGMLAGRLEFILGSELIPLGQMAEGRPFFVSYAPSMSELLVTVFGLAVILLIYTLGDRYLKLEDAG